MAQDYMILSRNARTVSTFLQGFSMTKKFKGFKRGDTLLKSVNKKRGKQTKLKI